MWKQFKKNQIPAAASAAMFAAPASVASAAAAVVAAASASAIRPDRLSAVVAMGYQDCFPQAISFLIFKQKPSKNWNSDKL